VAPVLKKHLNQQILLFDDPEEKKLVDKMVAVVSVFQDETPQ
jgi:hypothetical protein